MEIPKPPVMIECFYNPQYRLIGTEAEIRLTLQRAGYSADQITMIIDDSVVEYVNIQE